MNESYARESDEGSPGVILSLANFTAHLRNHEFLGVNFEIFHLRDQSFGCHSLRISFVLFLGFLALVVDMGTGTFE